MEKKLLIILKSSISAFFLIGLMSPILLSCEDKKENEGEDTNDTISLYKTTGNSEFLNLGKYVYMSKCRVLHTMKECPILLKEKDGLKNPVGIDFVDTSLICPNYDFWYCRECFSDEQYEYINNIIERNKVTEQQTDNTQQEKYY